MALRRGNACVARSGRAGFAAMETRLQLNDLLGTGRKPRRLRQIATPDGSGQLASGDALLSSHRLRHHPYQDRIDGGEGRQREVEIDLALPEARQREGAPDNAQEA